MIFNLKPGEAFMPSRQQAHPLNRYAPVFEYQREPCMQFATVLANPDSHRLGTIYKTMTSYSECVWGTAYPGIPKSAEHPIIEALSWQKALAESLRTHDHRAPDATARNVYELGMALHQWPRQIGQLSILRCVTIAARAYRVQIRLGHLEPICAILRSHDHGMTAEEHRDQYQWNARQVGELLSIAIEQDLTPKQLQIHIASLQGKPTAGRPRSR